MSVFGKAIKGTVGLFANGFDYVITKSSQDVENKYGKKELIRTAAEIGSNTVRVTEDTLKTLTDVVDGGIEAGIGYLGRNENKKSKGLKRAKLAGKEMVNGFGKGLVYSFEEGTRTTSSAVQAGKYYIAGNKSLAYQELGKTKEYAKNLSKVVIVSLLAFGVMDMDNDEEQKDEEK